MLVIVDILVLMHLVVQRGAAVNCERSKYNGQIIYTKTADKCSLITLKPVGELKRSQCLEGFNALQVSADLHL